MSKTEMPSEDRNESCTSPWPVMTDFPSPAAPVSFKQNSPRTYWSTCLQSVSWLALHCGSSILPWLPTFKLWKQTNIHSHGKDLKKKAPGKPSPSQYLLIAFSPVLKFSGWPPVRVAGYLMVSLEPLIQEEENSDPVGNLKNLEQKTIRTWHDLPVMRPILPHADSYFLSCLLWCHEQHQKNRGS